MPALLHDNAAVDSGGANLRFRAANAHKLSPVVVPGALSVAAYIVLADDRTVAGADNLQACLQILRYLDHQTAVVRVRLQAFAFPALRQGQGDTAVLHVGI